MVIEPNCFKRKCKHFLGVSDAPEPEQRVICEAFPDGIPSEIAYGPVEHTEPYDGDNGIRYEIAKE